MRRTPRDHPAHRGRAARLTVENRIDGRETVTRTGRERANISEGQAWTVWRGLIRLMDQVRREEVQDRAWPRRLVFFMPHKQVPFPSVVYVENDPRAAGASARGSSL
jgi:hypothetical protein